MATSTDGILMGTLPVSPPRAASNLLSQGVEWRFVVLEKGQPVLHTLKLEPNQTGETVMRLLRQKCKVNKAIGNWFHASVKLEDAIISPWCIGDPELQDYPRKVIIESSKPRTDLTKAFHNPQILQGTDFTRLNEQFGFATGTVPAGGQHHAILIKKTTSKYLVTGAVTAAILFAIIVGIVTGIKVKNAEIGLAVSAGTVGIFALIQASLFGVDSLYPSNSS